MRLLPPSVPGSGAATARVAAVLAAGSFVLLCGCSGGSSSPTDRTTPATTAPHTTPTAALCSPSSVSASVEFTEFGGSSSALAGGVLFRDIGGAPCALQGVPEVQVLAPDGQLISTYQAPGPAHLVTAVLTPAAPAGTGAQAASSITFSSWGCAVGSFSLTVRFPGWASSVPAAASGSTTSTTGPTTNVTGPPCAPAQEVDQTIYIGPVTPVTT